MKTAMPNRFSWTRAVDAGLTFRPIADADLPFLARVYASTRAEEFAGTPLLSSKRLRRLRFSPNNSAYSTHTTKSIIPRPTGW